MRHNRRAGEPVDNRNSRRGASSCQRKKGNVNVNFVLHDDDRYGFVYARGRRNQFGKAAD